MQNKQMQLDEVRQLMLSLLLARKGATPVPVLERDYREIESNRIPYRQFGYDNLVEFLQSMPEYFNVQQCNGGHYVRGIASEKSKHVGSLVARQKSKDPVPFHQRQPFNRRFPHMRSRPINIAFEALFLLMQYIKNNPHGVSLQNAVLYVQQFVPYVKISTQELRAQLRELSHELYLDGNMIYPICYSDLPNVACQQPSTEKPQMQIKSLVDSESPPTIQTMCVAGQENFDYVEYSSDESDFMPDHADNCQRHAQTSEQFATNFAQYANCEQTDTSHNKSNDIGKDLAIMNSMSNTEMNTTECFDLSQMISDRMKFRLKELMRKHPEGIWCAELPNVYLEEYKVQLNYTQLGFPSVREFTSYLPQIFYMTQVNKTDDFMLYSADKRPIVPKTEPIDITQSSHNRCDSSVQTQCSNEDNAPIPSNVSPSITKSFAPNNVMNYDDSVEKISVTELKHNRRYLEVYIVEVFHPNFFWIHLRENKRCFNQMMDELSDFYERNRNTYTIAKIALKKDMNCACVYMGRWHRGIIKSVKPDFRVTVLFYDYGTLKTYAPQDIYYLHKKFSFLPVQAIPCGLYNVKPNVGDRWKRSVIDQFVDKVDDTLLAASIVTIDSTYNSMMVILTDTSEEEDVRINDWLVKERLAQVGKTVRIHDIIYYLKSDAIQSSTSIKTFNVRSAVNVNKSRYRNQSISRDERTHRLSDVKSEDIENKTVKFLHNVPASKKALLQVLWNKSPDAKALHAKSPPPKSLDAKCPDDKSSDTEALDAKSQSRNYPQNRESRTLRKIPLLKKLKSFNRKSNYNPNTSTSEENTDNENNARQIDSNKKGKSQNNEKDYNYCSGYMNFSLRDSDEENTNDFGTFRSLYGGHGLMEPFDWSVIKEENNLHQKTATMPNNLNMSVKERESDIEDKSGSHNQRNEISGKQYFLNMTCMEKENFLSKNNIDYNIENMSDCMEVLRDKTLNHIVTVMFAPNNKFKTSHNSIQSEDTSNSNRNIVELSDASLREMDQEVDRNGKICETRVEQKVENRNSSTDSESVFSNISNNKDNINREMSERNTNNSFEFNTNNKVYPRYKMLLEKIKRKQMDLMNSNFVNANESSSSEQIQSSSYSSDTFNDTIISSNDEQSKESNCMDTDSHIEIHGLVKELESMSEELPKNLTLDKSHCNSEGTVLSPIETDSVTSSNIDIKQHRLNQSLKMDSVTSFNVHETYTKQHQLSQPFNSDSIVSSCNDDSKYQLNAMNQTTMDVSKLMRQMLKIAQNIKSNTDMDSDDLSSSQESVKDDQSDESKGDIKSIKLDSVSETCKSMNNDANGTEIAFAPPVYNDCNVESDESEWDAYAGSKEEDFPFYITQPSK